MTCNEENLMSKAITEAVVRGSSVIKMALKFCKNSKEKTCLFPGLFPTNRTPPDDCFCLLAYKEDTLICMETLATG